MLNAITFWNIYRATFRRNLLRDHLKARNENIYFCDRTYGNTNVGTVSHNARFSQQRPIASGTLQTTERKHLIGYLPAGIMEITVVI